MLEHALYCAAHGWMIHPLEIKGKKPLVVDWPNKATNDVETINGWWTKWPNANIGLATGAGSGVFVVDIDGPDGETAWETLQGEIDGIPGTLESTTGKGRHLFFRYPEGRKIGNRGRFRPGLDVRGEGGYVVAPPSVHPSGAVYAWAEGITVVAEAPIALLDVIAPPKVTARRPWDAPADATPTPPIPAKAPTHGTPVIERASLYLRQCEPAVQGSGGHNALLWAARSLVVGFELSDSDALSLLWSEFNPRCSPPWGEGDRKDFERKIAEARRTPSEKPRGWLLDEYGLRSGDEALTALGARFRDNLLASAASRRAVAQHFENEVVEIDAHEPLPDGFPLDCFPIPIRDYIMSVADVQVVEPAGVALSVLITAGSAIGNTCILRLKKGFDCRPTLWGVVVAPSGSNKTGPFREVIRPLRIPVPMHLIKEPMLSPQGQLLIEDATTESVLDVLSRSHRGLCLANGELTGWVGAFDRYSQSGGKRGKTSVDESIWLKLWDGDSYQKNRKTESENVLIHAATVSVVGCIQPEKLAEAFDPSQFASGLVPRLLVVSSPKRYRAWSEREMSDEYSQAWNDAIMFLRAISFDGINPNIGQYQPRIITLAPTAKARFVSEFNRIANVIHNSDAASSLFIAKSQGMIGRIALVLHGLSAACGDHKLEATVSLCTMERAIKMEKYLLAEQLRVYGLASEKFAVKQTVELRDILLKHADAGQQGVLRTVHRAEHIKYPKAEQLREAIQPLIDAGQVEWTNSQRTAYRVIIRSNP